MPDQAQEDARLLAAIPEFSWLTGTGQQWFTVSEVADALGIGAGVVRRWADDGRVPGAVLYGQQLGWRLPRSGLVAFLAAMQRGQEKPDKAAGA